MRSALGLNYSLKVIRIHLREKKRRERYAFEHCTTTRLPKCLEIDFVIDFGLCSMSTEERRRRTVWSEKETPRDCTREWMWIDVVENDFRYLETDDRRDRRFEVEAG